MCREITATTVANYADLLHLYSPGIVPSPIVDLKNTVNLVYAQKTGWLGYNNRGTDVIANLPASLTMCTETSKKCYNLPKLEEFNDYNFPNVTPIISGQITLEFWSYFSSINSGSFGLIIALEQQIGVALVSNQSTSTTLDAICFPQDYYSNIANSSGGQTVAGKSTAYTIRTNMGSNVDTQTTTSAANQWVWTRCAVDLQNTEFYVSSNTKKSIIGELLYDNVRNNYPFKHIFPEATKTSISIKGPSQLGGRTVYVSQILLFNDYLPQSYKFANM